MGWGFMCREKKKCIFYWTHVLHVCAKRRIYHLPEFITRKKKWSKNEKMEARGNLRNVMGINASTFFHFFFFWLAAAFKKSGHRKKNRHVFWRSSCFQFFFICWQPKRKKWSTFKCHHRHRITDIFFFWAAGLQLQFWKEMEHKRIKNTTLIFFPVSTPISLSDGWKLCAGDNPGATFFLLHHSAEKKEVEKNAPYLKIHFHFFFKQVMSSTTYVKRTHVWSHFLEVETKHDKPEKWVFFYLKKSLKRSDPDLVWPAGCNPNFFPFSFHFVILCQVFFLLKKKIVTWKRRKRIVTQLWCWWWQWWLGCTNIFSVTATCSIFFFLQMLDG